MSQSANHETSGPSIPLRWFQNIPTPVFILDEHGKITYCNDAFVELTGYLREEILGSGLDTMADQDGIQPALKDTLLLYEGRGLRRRQYDFIRKTGTKVHVVTDLTPVYGEGHRVEMVTNVLGIVLESQVLG